MDRTVTKHILQVACETVCIGTCICVKVRQI